jgi:hypothetical protein
MKRYFLLVAILVLSATACKKELTKTSLPGNTNTNNAADIGVNPPICSLERWENIGTFPGHMFGLVYNNKLYVPDRYNNVVRIFDGNSWTSIASNVPDGVSFSPSGNNLGLGSFVIGNKGYFFDLVNPQIEGFWEYNFNQNTWHRKSDFIGSARTDCACFSLGARGFVVGGMSQANGNTFSQTWIYDQSLDRWFETTGIGNPALSDAVVTSIRIYFRWTTPTGANQRCVKQLLEFDPSTALWTQRAEFPGHARQSLSVFVIGNKVYAGGGWDAASVPYGDFYSYAPGSNSWSQIASIPGLISPFGYFGFAINSTGYYVANFDIPPFDNHIYQYFPQVCTQ